MAAFRVNGRIWIETGAGERFMGIGRLELLQHIQRTGSINQAAKAMNMSYKRAWDLIQSLNAIATRPLVITQTGGQKGGGASLSPEGLELLAYYEQVRSRFLEFMARESEAIQSLKEGFFSGPTGESAGSED